MGKISRKNMLKDSGLSDGLYNEADLSRGERAAMIGVAVGGQALFESGETMYPLTQVAPGGSRGDVGTVKLCQLRAAILPDAERFHATKLLFFHRIDEGVSCSRRPRSRRPTSTPASTGTTGRVLPPNRSSPDMVHNIITVHLSLGRWTVGVFVFGWLLGDRLEIDFVAVVIPHALTLADGRIV